MSNINKRLTELSPFVLSIRFTNGITVVDTSFKDGWTVPKIDKIGFETIPDNPNYYMLYPNDEETGIDEMLDYVSLIIKVNVERENKIKLLQLKINELKDIFTKNSLSKCESLIFQFKNVEIGSSNIELSDIPLSIKDVEPKQVDEPIIESNVVNEVKEPEPALVADDIIKNNKTVKATAKVKNEIFDLPPKKGEKIVVEDFDEPKIVCKCDPNDPNQVCPECIGY